VYLKALQLTHFKNYEAASAVFHPRMNGILGLNGMGKTNLLEAIWYLCIGKSYFNLPDRLLIRKGAGFFRLEGHFHRQGKSERIVAKVAPGRPKTLEHNGKPVERLADHVGFLPVVMITPDDTLLATGGSEERRKFLDVTLSQTDPRYLRHLLEVNKLLRQRNAALKQMGQSGHFDPTLLQTYEEQMLEPSAYIYGERRKLVEALQPLFQEFYEQIAQGAERVSCSYHSQLHEAPLVSLFQKSREKDRLLQRTTSGVHKDDLSFEIKGMPLKRFASQGQLKSYVLALKLAQYAFLRRCKGLPPLLLLDDLFDKLDRTRVLHLLKLLADEPFGQVFITDTHPDRLPELLARQDHPFGICRVHQGTLQMEERVKA